MKSTDSHRIRYVCRVVRRLSAWTGLPFSSHVAGCSGCREHIVAEAKLESSLRRAARQTTATVPAGLEDRILEAIPYRPVTTGRSSPARRSRHRSLVFALAGAAAIAVAAIVAIRPAGEAPPIAQQDESEPANAPVVAVAGSEGVSLDFWRERLAGLTPTNPLEREIDAVYSDTRSALRFLALNFLPSEPEILLPPEERRT